MRGAPHRLQAVRPSTRLNKAEATGYLVMGCQCFELFFSQKLRQSGYWLSGSKGKVTFLEPIVVVVFANSQGLKQSGPKATAGLVQHSVWHYGGGTLKQLAAVRYSSAVPA